jgi:hypothetical protein
MGRGGAPPFQRGPSIAKLRTIGNTDVLTVTTGPARTTFSHVLTIAGLKVLILDAGPQFSDRPRRCVKSTSAFRTQESQIASGKSVMLVREGDGKAEVGVVWVATYGVSALRPGNRGGHFCGSAVLRRVLIARNETLFTGIHEQQCTL